MTFSNRNGKLYASINGVRKSTKLKYSKENIKKFKSYYQDEEFFNNFNINKNVPKVVELCQMVLDEKETTLKRNSYRSYEILFNSRIKSFFKDKLVNEITPGVINDFYNSFTDKSTLRTCNAILKFAFEKAIIKGFISFTPLQISKPKFKNDYEINPFTFDEAKIIIDFAPALVRNLIATLFYTGARTGEMLGLKWINVDFQNYTIKIDNQFTGGFEETPKTKSSIRIIDMLPICEKYLKEQLKITSSSDYVFLNANNLPFRSSTDFRYIWKKILIAKNIEYRSIYQTRHTFASNMLSNGENPLWVSQMLGHKSLDITLQKYSKYIKRENQKRKISYLDIT
jgi:integrase